MSEILIDKMGDPLPFSGYRRFWPGCPAGIILVYINNVSLALLDRRACACLRSELEGLLHEAEKLSQTVN